MSKQLHLTQLQKYMFTKLNSSKVYKQDNKLVCVFTINKLK